VLRRAEDREESLIPNTFMTNDKIASIPLGRMTLAELDSFLENLIPTGTRQSNPENHDGFSIHST